MENVHDRCEASSKGTLDARVNPKLASFNTPYLLSKSVWGFKSQCNTRFECTFTIPLNIWCTSDNVMSTLRCTFYL